MARNLEIKVACDDDGLALVRTRLAEHGREISRRMRHVDTYFRVVQGRLKLREIEDLDRDGSVAAELIGYVRPDASTSRWSSYAVTPIGPGEVTSLRTSLDATLGILVRVAKRRDVAIWDATRVHLDVVDGLGAFVELETVIDVQPDAHAVDEHNRVIAALGLDRWEPISGSYSDLLLAKSR